jgi:hypothetical protein
MQLPEHLDVPPDSKLADFHSIIQSFNRSIVQSAIQSSCSSLQRDITIPRLVN